LLKQVNPICLSLAYPAGVAKQIKKLGDDGVKFKLALSLHAPNDAKRNEIIPINETNNRNFIFMIRQYFTKTGSA
jgi:23S rRNA (adenine2503-C2)-methyltransferase